MEVTAALIADLRRRQADLERSQATARGHYEAARAAAASMTDRMRQEYGVEDLAALEARLAEHDEKLVSEADAVRIAIEAAERVLP